MHDHRWCHIVVVVDGSPAAASAVREAVQAAVRHNARLTLLGVVSEPSPLVASGGICPERLKSDMIACISRELSRLVAEIPQTVGVTTLVRCGSVTSEILHFLRGGSYDVLFLGADERGWMRRWVSRALRARLVRRAPCEVRVLPVRPAPAQARPAAAPRRRSATAT